MQQLFEILVEGRFAPERIRTKIATGTMRRTEDSEACIERHWQEGLASGFKPWPEDLNPTRCRFVDAKVTDGDLVVTIDPCVSYRDCVAGESEAFRDRFGQDFLPRALAVSALILARTESGEERMLITLRKPGHDYKPGGYHASIGGMMDSRWESDVTSAVLREIREESGIFEADLAELTAYGVVKNRWRMHPDVVFKAVTNVPVEAILRRKHDEENNLIFVPRSRRHLEEWIVEPLHAGVVIATAAMLMIGRDLVERECDTKGEPIDGQRWYERMLDILAWCSRDYDDSTERVRLERRDMARLAWMVEQERAR